MKKAQAAMEFLMTYGWAILVVLIAIGALVYFVKPQQILGQNCILSPGLNCKSYKAETTGITLLIENPSAKDITVTDIDFPDVTACTFDVPTCIGGMTINSGDNAECEILCTGTDTLSGNIRSDVTVTYDEVGGLGNMTNAGTVFLRVT